MERAALAKQATKTVIHKAQLSKQTANVVTKAVIHKDQQRRQQQLWQLELMWQNWQLNQFILIIINDFSGDHDGGVASFREDFVGQQTGP